MVYLRVITLLSFIALWLAFGAGVASEEDGSEINATIDLLSNRDTKIVKSAIDKLSSIGQPAVQALLEATVNKPGNVLVNAMIALGRIAKDNNAAIPALVLKLSRWNFFASYGIDDMDNVLSDTIQSLGADALPCLIVALWDENPSLVDVAGIEIGKMGENAAPAIPYLIIALKDSSQHRRIRAARTIERIGPTAYPAVEALLMFLNEHDNEVRESACKALASIGPAAENAIPELEVLLKSDNSRLRIFSAFAIFKIKPDRRDCLDILLDALGTGEKDIRWLVSSLVGDIKPEQVTISALIKALSDESDVVVSNAIRSLANLIPLAKDAHLDLEEINTVASQIVTDKKLDSDDRTSAAFIIASIEPNPNLGISTLISMLDYEAVFQNHNAIIYLGQLGAKATDALPKLQEIANTFEIETPYGVSYYTVQQAARNAIRLITQNSN